MPKTRKAKKLDPVQEYLEQIDQYDDSLRVRYKRHRYRLWLQQHGEIVDNPPIDPRVVVEEKVVVETQPDTRIVVHDCTTSGCHRGW